MGQSRNVLLVAGAIAFLLFFVGSVSASPATRIPAAARAHEITKLAAWSSRGPVLALMYTGPLGGTLDASLRRAKVPAPLVRQACAAAKQDSALSSLGRLSAGSYELLAVRRGRQLQLVETHVWEADRDYRLYRYVGAVSPEWVDGQGRFVTHANLVRPVEGGRMSSGFGWRVHPVLGDWRFHNGVDFALPKGSPVFAAENARAWWRGVR